jgi:hypothetical protein
MASLKKNSLYSVVQKSKFKTTIVVYYFKFPSHRGSSDLASVVRTKMKKMKNVERVPSIYLFSLIYAS